jgi:choline dehydrogenase-like flavoprotein
LAAPGDRVGHVRAVRESGDRVVVRARAVVLAAGGIENARLLLAADGRRGVGNEHDLVGRYFAERLSFYAGHLELGPSTTIEDLASLHQFPGSAVGGGLRLTNESQRERSLRNCIFYLVPRPTYVTRDALRALSTLRKVSQRRPIASGLTRHVRDVLTDGLAVAAVAKGRSGEPDVTLTLRVQGEPTPDPTSRVVLSRRRDKLGLPMAHVHWKISEADLRSIRESAEVLDRALASHQLGRVVWTAEPGGATLIEGNHHHLGTTRLHGDPQQGVVDADCRVHSIQNLFVAGSSVMPSYGASNPTLTILALALRLADHLSQSIDAD